MLAFGSGKMVGGQTIIAALTLLTGEGNHHFEAGGGVFHIDDIIVPFFMSVSPSLISSPILRICCPNLASILI